MIEKQIEVEGLPVRYLEGGEDNGRALLLLHGGIGGARATWAEVLPSLAEKFHVFAPDLPGYGETAPLPEMTLDNLVHWLRALLDALGQTDAVVVGASVGGLLARLFAAAEPQYVPAIILVNGGVLPRIPGYLPAIARLPVIGDPALRLFARMTYADYSPDRTIVVREVVTDDLCEAWRASARGFEGLMRALVFYTPSSQPTPPVPTLLLWGANDPVMPLALAEHLKGEIPGAVLSPVADCGHMPQLEASDAFAFQIISFLEGLSRARHTTMPGVGMLRPDSA